MTSRPLLPALGIVSVLAVVLAQLLAPAAARASSPSLQLNPLKYEDTLAGSQIKSGHIDVANPSDSTIAVVADVQGFRQADLDGNLEFFTDPRYSEAIIVGLTSFNLGPRESIRVSFSVNPASLPKGGVYAAIFFRTVPPVQTSTTSYVSESANVGTLLLLQNGPPGDHIGALTAVNLPFLQFGDGIAGRARYQNTNRTTAPAAFAPRLTSRVLPWGRPAAFTGPLVLPGATRQFAVHRPGSFLGLLPVILTDSATGQSIVRWVLACTGWYAFAGLFLAILLIIFLSSRLLRRLPLIPAPLRLLIHRLLRRPRPLAKHPLDGLSRKS